MPGGAYSALSGMQARLEDLDRLASDLANVGTSGYKTERAATVAAERPSFRAALDSAVDVTTGGTTRSTSARAPSASTGRDLDVGDRGRRLLRGRHARPASATRATASFVRRADGVLTTADGCRSWQPAHRPAAPGRSGSARGQISISEDGTVKRGRRVAGQAQGGHVRERTATSSANRARGFAPAPA